MNRNDLIDALDDVARTLKTQRATARVYIVGGAAMALAYDADRSTRDIGVKGRSTSRPGARPLDVVAGPR